jgi:molecular chaperone DnaK (HSP70)
VEWHCVLHSAPQAHGGAGDGVHHADGATAGTLTVPVSAFITARQFEDACDGLFQRTLAPVQAALSNANLSPQEVDEVVLVGGSSRLPRVRELLSAALHKPRLHHTVDPDLAVAMGAASMVD